MTYGLAPKARVNGVAPRGAATGIMCLKSLDQEEPMLAAPKMQEALKCLQ
jgi:hypothetical protein